ncbi:hypothetical protein NM688_g4569 [Phlebia brevispora]|uniref:Uncharacterized protein n=1 Tax=Phlebia brevispora TaxID=194682 RepID=A0ACC1T371_9APHY|nr:hypothetical protein NM688_g4569 [Phlebia brevispora]
MLHDSLTSKDVAHEKQVDAPPSVHGILSAAHHRGPKCQIRPKAYCIRRPQYLPSEWTLYINPEGAQYFVNPTLNLVTDTAITRPRLYECILKGFRELQGVASGIENALSQGSECFIQAQEVPDVTEEHCKCNYYLVDHDTQTEFWLHPINPYDLGIAQVTSESHIKHILQKHYWTHVEYFPHRPVSMKLRKELINVLRHGQLDMMTSRTSTFPYTVAQCEKFIKLLHQSLNDTNDMYVTSMTARLWSTISHHRYDNYFGEYYARLERDHYVLGEPQRPREIGMNFVSAIFFGVPLKINEELEALFVDNTVYGMHWQNFMGNMIESWKESRLLAVSLVIADGILLTIQKGPMSLYVGFASILLSSISLVSSLALLQRYGGAADQVANEALVEMCKVEHQSLRFQPAAILYSIPKALVNWSGILLITTILSVLLEFSTSWAAVIMLILLAVVVSVTLITLVIQWGVGVWGMSGGCIL